MKSVLCVLFCAVVFVQWMGCTGGRVVAHFVPSTTDYRFFPCDTLRANPQSDAPWTRTSFRLPPLPQWLPKRHLERYEVPSDTALQHFLTATGTTSFIVVRNDSILCEHYLNGYRPDQPQIVFSVGKTIVSTLVAIAVGEGKMRVDQSIADFIPEFGNDDRRRITVRHLLNMTSGINWMDNLDLWRLSSLYYNYDLERFVLHHSPLKYVPGTHFSYKSIGTQLLGMCLERAVGKTAAQYMDEKLWKPLGMEHPGLFTKDSNRGNNNRMYGGIALSAPDMLRFGRLFLNKGEWNGQQIVPRWWVEELSNRKIEADKWWGYTNCWWLNGYLDGNFLDGTDFFAAGFKDQFIYIHPKYNMLIVRTGDKRDSGPDWPVTFGRLTALMNEGDNDFTNPDKDFAEQFEGVYETRRGERIEVVFHGKKEAKDKTWGVWKEVNQTVKMQHWYDLYQVDGQSLAYRSYGRQIRLVFEVINGKIVGLYLSDLFSIDSKYFDKKGDLPADRKKLSKR